jgi:hypothetical protein
MVTPVIATDDTWRLAGYTKSKLFSLDADCLDPRGEASGHVLLNEEPFLWQISKINDLPKLFAKKLHFTIGLEWDNLPKLFARWFFSCELYLSTGLEREEPRRAVL